MWSERTRRLVELACAEDLDRAGDVTSALLPRGAQHVAARVVARQAGIACGLDLAPLVCEVFSSRLQQGLEWRATLRDGDALHAGAAVATLAGPQAAVLAVERTLLNFLGRLSGVATLTRQYVDAARHVNPHVKILDTRKTLPGWRELDKAAVRAGGGHNHRFGLYDAVLIKDNHLAGVPLEQLSAFLAQSLGRLRQSVSFVEVEVDSLDQLSQVLRVPGVDIVLLDNFTPPQMQAAVAARDAQGLRGKVELEASGGVRLDTLAAIAASGVDRISVGALTHSAVGCDLALDF